MNVGQKVKQTAQQTAQQVAKQVRDEALEMGKSTIAQVENSPNRAEDATQIAANNFNPEASTIDQEAIKQQEQKKLNELRARLAAMMESGMQEARQERTQQYQDWQQATDQKMQQGVQEEPQGAIIAQGKPSRAQQGQQRATQQIQQKRETGRGNKG